MSHRVAKSLVNFFLVTNPARRVYKPYIHRAFHEKLIGQVSILYHSRVMAATADTEIRRNCRRLHLPFIIPGLVALLLHVLAM